MLWYVLVGAFEFVCPHRGHNKRVSASSVDDGSTLRGSSERMAGMRKVRVAVEAAPVVVVVDDDASPPRVVPLEDDAVDRHGDHDVFGSPRGC